MIIASANIENYCGDFLVENNRIQRCCGEKRP
ncbi:MAG: hypothetical protein H6R18_345 [Proteobacteria bacterium]|nr:hypothetical protein [Pseudomonadota bacterium]